jgi:hypothetical protein
MSVGSFAERAFEQSGSQQCAFACLSAVDSPALLQEDRKAENPALGLVINKRKRSGNG